MNAPSHLETLLIASCTIAELRREVATLKSTVEAKDKRIAALEGQLRRSTPRWPINDLNANVRNEA